MLVRVPTHARTAPAEGQDVPRIGCADTCYRLFQDVSLTCVDATLSNPHQNNRQLLDSNGTTSVPISVKSFYK